MTDEEYKEFRGFAETTLVMGAMIRMITKALFHDEQKETICKRLDEWVDQSADITQKDAVKDTVRALLNLGKYSPNPKKKLKHRPDIGR